ncbi:LysM peptidoglycan-binding domain-containing protein [Variovorax sp. PAMC28562]|uniref:LysM peptidoglycan-binding domain-containing protein n=1 Tax=Variovorax sp. PAMC28562 TaxID=2762323 RepID=UPI00164D6604|nr:LysM domain-containing protein [Variovorax sp. PAMC28562]QNK73062.1 LysM peptidoglycan-binding domain-containing protein [Variovorax sp. PAMC28562]
MTSQTVGELFVQRQLIVNGEVLGRYGATADHSYDGTVFAQMGTFFKSDSEFSFGYQPIDGNYPAGSPGTYAVAAGDTLQTIAKGAYGDANLWYLIADANGLSSNGDLRAGQVLTIPTAVGSANSANTFRPYDPSRITGNTSPTLMAQPQDKGGCGAIGTIIVVIVAVVVAIFAPELIPAIGQLGGVLGGAASAALGSVASQAVGVAIGAQDSFSWKGVALAAVSGGISGGLSGVDFTGSGTVSSIGNRIIQSAAGNALTQGVGVATGLQSSFSWRSVAASAVSAGVGQGINEAMGSRVRQLIAGWVLRLQYKQRLSAPFSIFW